MKIIIVGAGKIGFALAEQLGQEGHDIVVIDTDEEVLSEMVELLDVACVTGNGALLQIQKTAGVQNADLLIAVTGQDEINLLSCLFAKKLGCKNTIARVRNPDYAPQLRLMRDEMGLSLTINPERSAANEVFRILQLPMFTKRDTLARGQVELVEFTLTQSMPFCGKRLEQLGQAVKAKFVICAVKRGDEVTIPKGGFELKERDVICLASFRNDLVSLAKYLGLAKHKMKDIMILGGSRMSFYLAERLARSGADVKIIEQQLERCRVLSDMLPRCLVIHGDATSNRLLHAENMEGMDAVVSLMDLDEENIIACLYANSAGVEKSIAKLNRTELGFTLGSAGSSVSPKLLAAGEIVRYVRDMQNAQAGEVVSLHRLLDDQVEALEFRITNAVSKLNIPLKQMPIKKGVIVAAIIRAGNAFTPTGDDCFMLDDTVVVAASKDMHISHMNMIFRNEG